MHVLATQIAGCLQLTGKGSPEFLHIQRLPGGRFLISS